MATLSSPNPALDKKKKKKSLLPQWQQKMMDKAKETVPVTARITKLKPKSVETKIKKVEKKEMKPMPEKKKEKKKEKKEKWYPGKKLGIKYFSPESKSKRKKTMTSGEKRQAKKGPKDYLNPAASTQQQYATELVDVKPSPATIPGQKTRKVKVEETKGGDYPFAKAGSETARSFNKTFRDNRKAGKKTFTWQGRSYSTRQAGEGKWNAETGKWGKAAKKQMGGPVSDKPFRQGIKYYEGGGQVTTSNNKAASGDVVNVHSHSGYKAGK